MPTQKVSTAKKPIPCPRCLWPSSTIAGWQGNQLLMRTCDACGSRFVDTPTQAEQIEKNQAGR